MSEHSEVLGVTAVMAEKKPNTLFPQNAVMTARCGVDIGIGGIGGLALDAPERKILGRKRAITSITPITPKTYLIPHKSIYNKHLASRGFGMRKMISIPLPPKPFSTCFRLDGR